MFLNLLVLYLMNQIMIYGHKRCVFSWKVEFYDALWLVNFETHSEWLDKWDGKNHQILTWFHNTCANVIKLDFRRFDTTKEIWDFLESRYSRYEIFWNLVIQSLMIFINFNCLISFIVCNNNQSKPFILIFLNYKSCEIN